ncbi:MAG: sugar transferase [Calditrichaeota bacterium]|nr:sugar transferase [Calditrichota bacterium]MCB9368372.1 sugar transferase [Calditrichota bacterium]
MRPLWFRGLLFVADFVVLELAFFGIYWWRFQTGMFSNPVVLTPVDQIVPSLVVSGYWVLHFAVFGLYRFDPLASRAVVAVDCARAAFYGCLVIFLVTFDPTNPLPVTRVVLLTYGLGVTAGVSIVRLTLLTVLQELRIRGIMTMRTLVVGSGKRLESLLHILHGNKFLGANILGVLSPEQESTTEEQSLGAVSDARAKVAELNCELVYVAFDETNLHYLDRTVTLLSSVPARLFVPADHYQRLLGEVRPLGRPSFSFVEIRADLLTPIESALKRVFDLILSSMMLVLTSPVWVIASILILVESGFPIFYAQTRIGLHGRKFKILKFRSMIKDAERETGPVLVSPGDERVTRIGRFLRSTRIDELPQLLNILFGQMSLVGPRPERPEFAEEFSKLSPLFVRRQNVKPGLTGWAQVHLQYDATISAPEKKLELDLFYIENMSIPLDLKILYMTLFVVLRGEG